MKLNFCMKRLISLIAVFLFTANLFADEIIIGASTTSGTTSYVPTNGNANSGWSAIIYNDYELDGAAIINRIEFQHSLYGGANMVSFQKVYLLNISDSVFINSDYIDLLVLGASLVYDGVLNIQSSLGFQGITLQTPFLYTGGNLLMLWENRDGSFNYSPTWYYTPTSSNNKVKYAYTNGNFPFGSGSLTNNRPNTKFVYTPTILNDLSIDEWVFPTNGTVASSALSITIKIKNRCTTLQSNFNVKYSIDNGQTWVQQNYSGTIQPGAYQNITFNTTASMATGGLYRCVAVVKSPNDSVSSNDTLRKDVFICGGSYSGTYIVGDQSGDHFPNLTTGIIALSNCGMSGSVTLRIRPGCYHEQITIPSISGLNSSKTLTIESFTGNRDVVYSFSSSSHSDHLKNFTLKFDGSDFITLKDLIVKNTSSNGGGHALYILSSKNNRFENCEFHGVINPSSVLNSYSTIYFSGTSSSPYRQNIFINNTIKYGSYGLYGSSASSMTYGMRFIGNTITEYSYDGVFLQYMDSLYFQNNVLNTSSINNTIAVYLGNISNNLNFIGNKIRTNVGYGVYFYSCQLSATERGKVYNNWIFSDSMQNSIYGLHANSCNNLDIEHNSFYFINPNSSTYSAYSVRLVNCNNNIFRNNSLVNEANGMTVYSDNSSFTFFDYNNLYTNGPYLAFKNANYSTLASLQNGTNTNLNSTTSAGVYYSILNLHSNSSSLNNLGSPLSPVSVDIDGQPRSSSAPDIGADEFDIFANDGGVTGILGIPISCAGTVLPITVTMKNYGTQAITSAHLKMSINGAIMHQQWSGNLSPGGSINVFLGSRSFSADTIYSFKAWVDSVNHFVDLNNYNDSAFFYGYRTILSGSYTIGSSSNADFSGISQAIQALYQYGICGPVVFNIESGNYYGNYSLSTQPSGMSSVNTVTFQSLTGDTSDVMLYYHAIFSSENYIINLENISDFRFKNMTFKVFSNIFSRAIYLVNTHRISFDSCLFVSKYPGGSQSILLSSYKGGNISITNSKFVKSSFPISISGVTSDYYEGITIHNNEIVGFVDYGIYLSKVDTVSIMNNTIKSGINSGIHGLQIMDCKSKLDIGHNDINIKSISGSAHGMILYDINYPNYLSSAQIYIYNNFIYTNTTTTNGLSYAIYCIGDAYAKFLFNTLKSDGGNSTCASFYSEYTYNSLIYNNNMYSENGYAHYRETQYHSLSDYNNYYSNGPYILRVYNSVYSISTFPNYLPTSFSDSYSKTVNPGFIAIDDLHVFNQDLNGGAIPYGGITVDFDGESRSSTTPDIGADEFNLFSLDVAPLSVKMPTNPSPIGNNSVKVNIQNLGATGLISTNIFFRLDGGAIDSNYWTGSLNFLEVDSLIDLGSINVTAGSHTLEVWTNHPNGLIDLNPANDTLLYNFNSIPLPHIEVLPTTLSDSITTCNSASNQSVKIYNRGNANLTIGIDSSQYLSSDIDVVMLCAGSTSMSYLNSKSIIQNNLNNVNIIETFTTDSAYLSSLLVGKDIVLVPTLLSSSILNTYSDFGPVLQKFVNNGGSVIFLGSPYNNANYIWNTGLFSGTYIDDLYLGASIPINNLNHPIFKNHPNSFITTSANYYYYSILNTDAIILATYLGYPLIAERNIGRGTALLLGFDNYSLSNDATTMLVNAINYCGAIHPFVSNSSFTQTILPGDSLTFSFQFDANGLLNGWYDDILTISHNDINQSKIIIPCSLYIYDTCKLTINKPFHAFDTVYTGNQIVDSIYLVNTGCQDLHIFGILSGDSHLLPLKLSDIISPGDSVAFQFRFTPNTSGVYAMPISIYNSDTVKTFNFSGVCIAAPLITLNPNPLIINSLFCEDSLIVPVTITNSGEVPLIGNIASASSGDSLEVLILTLGTQPLHHFNLTSALDDYFTKYNLISLNISSTSQLNAAIQGKDVVIIPAILNNNYHASYMSFKPIFQSFVNNGGLLIFAGQIDSDYLIPFDFFKGSSKGLLSNVNLSLNTNHAITGGIATPAFATSNDNFVRYKFTNSNKIRLVEYLNDDVTALMSYGNGNVIYLGFTYSSSQGVLANRIASKSLEYAYLKKNNGLFYSAMNFTLMPGNSTILNVKFISKDVIKGQHTSSIMINTNIPDNSIIQLPCILNVHNELDTSDFLGSDTTLCGSKQLDAGYGFSTYQWNVGGNSQLLIVTNSGCYAVTVTNNGHCFSSDSIYLTIHSKPNALISGLPNILCTDYYLIQMVGTPSGGQFAGSGVSGNIFNPALASIGLNPITYSVTSANGCTDVDTVIVDVKMAPTASAGADTSLPCQNGGVQLGQQPFAGVSYSWYPALGLNNDNIANPISNVNYSINYVLTATATNGCQAYDTVHISVAGGPNAIVSNDTTICAGETVTLNVSGGDSYLWSTGDTTTSITVTPMVTTEYFVVASQSNCADLDTITVNVNRPNPHLPSDTFLCAGNSISISPGTFTAYLWSTGSVSPFITVDSTGVGIGSITITVEVTDINGCSNSDTIVISFKNCLGIGENAGDNLVFSLYPNPTNGIVTLKSTGTALQNVNYMILDISGAILKKGKIANTTGYFDKQFDLRSLAKGVYFVRLQTNNQTATMKLTLQ